MAKQKATLRRSAKSKATPKKRKRPAGNENVQLRRELAQARQEQGATAEILRAISRSTNDLRPVLDAIAETAAHLCGADYAFVYKLDADTFHLAASNNANAAWVQYVRDHPVGPGRGTVVGRTLLERRTVHVKDVLADREYTDLQRQRLGNYRSMLGVPLLRDQTPIGSIVLLRTKLKPFSVSQANLVETFADQAVIAIENVRLFDEVQAKTHDLEESLQQQTATSEVLEVISSSPADLEPVFSKMLESATRVCRAQFGTMTLFEGGNFRTVALYRIPEDYIAHMQPSWRPHPKSGLGTLARTLKTVQIADLRLQPPYLEGDPAAIALADLAKARTIVMAPMLKDGGLVGALAVFNQEVRPFTPKQVELLENFAKQAVIAIENTRLLKELRQRTDDLSEALSHQTGSSNILKVIASSPTEVQPVLQAIVESACELCGAYDAVLRLKQGDRLERGAHHGPVPPNWNLSQITPRWTAGRAVIKGNPVHVHDMSSCEGDEFPEAQARAREQGHRTILSVPLLQEGASIGAITLRRLEVSPFTEKQIALLQTFADQAVIAIGNVRLFQEVQTRTRDLSEALTHQTASATVLRVIASSPTDIGPVLSAIVESACELCQAYDAIVRLRAGDRLVSGAHFGRIPINEETWPIDRDSVSGRAVIAKEPMHIRDMQSSEGDEFPESQERARRLGHRTILSAPLIRDDECIGVIILRRIDVNPFTETQIALLQTFADQAAIAIGNVRLFEQVQERTRELGASLDELRAAQDRLVQTEKLASLGQLTAGIAHEIKNPLNFVNNFSALSVELTDELKDVLKQAQLAEMYRREVDDLTSLLQDNLSKVIQHGKRADSIVKNMLLHSREGTSERRSADVNSLVRESLNLAYHGARAEKPEFNIVLKQDLDPSVGSIELYPQELTRALLNLISNGIYAATRRKRESSDELFEPVLTAATRDRGKTVEIRIRDNGIGIPPDVREKMFNPFFTTKPTGEGTGLGLSITHDIIVKQHGGSIEVDTSPGEFAEIRLILPRTGALLSGRK